jgi:hypothetical protein
MPTLTGPNDSATSRGWRILDNVWNPETLVYPQDYTIGATYSASSLPNGASWSGTFPAQTQSNYYHVHAYPEILFGASPWWGGTNPTDPNQVFPIQVSDIASLKMHYNLNFGGDTNGYNVAFELWLTNVPNGGSTSMTNEIMVWFHHGSFSPGGSFLTGYNSQYFSGQLFDTPNWNIVSGSQWRYTAVESNNDAPSGELDLGALLQSLQSQGIITGNEYLADLELGSEVATGQGYMTLNSLDYEIQTHSGHSYVVGGISGTSGNDALSGGPGIQTAVYAGPAASYTITRNGSTTTVSGPDGTDTLTGIEQIAFSDQIVTLGQGPSARDFNSDLCSDVLWQNTNGQYALWEMAGTSSPSGAGFLSVQPGSDWTIIGTSDFDGDGKADILWKNSNNGQMAVWEMNGTVLAGGGFTSIQAGTDWSVIGTGDFDGDGKGDILWKNTTTGQMAIWQMNGTTVAGGGFTSVQVGAEWSVLGTADFDGDGKADILWKNTSTGQLAIWLMNGTTVAGGGFTSIQVGSGWTVLGTGYFNGDGKADILWQNASGQLALWLMNGTTVSGGGFVSAQAGSDWNVIGTSDYNGDGKADILWQNATGQVAVWTMNGTSVLQGAIVGQPGTTWHTVG